MQYIIKIEKIKEWYRKSRSNEYLHPIKNPSFSHHIKQHENPVESVSVCMEII